MTMVARYRIISRAEGLQRFLGMDSIMNMVPDLDFADPVRSGEADVEDFSGNGFSPKHWYRRLPMSGGFNVRLVLELVGPAFSGRNVAAFADIDWLID